jgi:hypothetical protein
MPTQHSDAENATDDPTYTYHHEPPEQGGARYVRCSACGIECVPANPDRIPHRDDCPGASR